MFEQNKCQLELDSLAWRYLIASASAGCAEAGVIVGLQHFANTNTFDHESFKHALQERDFCALYDYGMSIFARNSSSEEDIKTIVDCFQTVVEQDGDGSEYPDVPAIHPDRPLFRLTYG